MHCTNYDGRSINKLKKRRHSVSFQNIKIWNMRFVGNLICEIHWIFFFYMKVMSLLSRHLYWEHSQPVRYSFTTRQVLNSIVSYKKNEQVQQANLFKRQTLMFHYSTYCPNSFKHLSKLVNKFLNAWCKKNNAGRCLSHWRTVDCTSVSDAKYT